MSEVAVARNASVSASVKLAAFAAGRKAGKTNKEIAASLGMKEGSFSVSISQLRKRFAEDAAAKAAKGETVVNPFVEIDKLKVTRSAAGKNVFDNAELLAALDAGDEDVEERADVFNATEVAAEGETAAS